MPSRRPVESDDEHQSPSPGATPSATLAVRQRSSTRDLSGSKRKRGDTVGETSQNRRRRTAELANGIDLDGDDDDDNDNNDNDNNSDGNGSHDSIYEDVYDPDQPVEERRFVQKSYRDLLRDVTENSEEYLKVGSRGLNDAIRKADDLSMNIRQTTEATIDSRLLLSTTDLSYRKTLRLTQGSLSQGLDVDEFVSKCITYMRQGRGIENDDALELSNTQRQRRVSHARGRANDEEIGDEGDMMNWAHLGRFAALPHIRRPALPGFLLGPLSVEKKVRKVTKRSAPFRPDRLAETRPEVLNVEKLSKKENDLTAICGKILLELTKLQAEAQETVAELVEDEADEKEQIKIMHQHGLRSTGGIDMMRFVVNPHSFGQTIENMFYVSFLIRDGRIQIEFDEFDLPTLAPVDHEMDPDVAQRGGTAKHQAILAMDMDTWKDIIETFQLKEPMIQHREEITHGGPGARGWYS